jgi:hypothetical protein
MIAFRFSTTSRVWPSMRHSSIAGASGHRDLTGKEKTMFPAPIACEYGPIAAGGGFFLDLLLVSFGISLLLVTAWFVEWPYRSGGPSFQD